MPMFNTAAIRVQPLQGASRQEFVRDATNMAKRLGVSVVFCWGTVWEFWFHPDSDVDQNFKDLLALINQEMLVAHGEFRAPDPLASDAEQMAKAAQIALRGLNNNEPQEK